MATVTSVIDIEQIAKLQDIISKIDEITEINTFTVKLSPYAYVSFVRQSATNKWISSLTVTEPSYRD